MRDTRFRDRTQAGRIPATRLAAYANRSDVLVLALPREGIPVGLKWRERCMPRWATLPLKGLKPLFFREPTTAQACLKRPPPD